MGRGVRDFPRNFPKKVFCSICMFLVFCFWVLLPLNSLWLESDTIASLVQLVLSTRPRWFVTQFDNGGCWCEVDHREQGRCWHGHRGTCRCLVQGRGQGASREKGSREKHHAVYTGVIGHYIFWEGIKQAANVAGIFEGFPLQKCIVLVGNIVTLVDNTGSLLFDGSNFKHPDPAPIWCLENFIRIFNLGRVFRFSSILRLMVQKSG